MTEHKSLYFDSEYDLRMSSNHYGEGNDYTTKTFM